MKKIAAIFIDAKGHYPTMEGIDCYDIQRDARTFAFDKPVIAHPPCQLWGNLAFVNFKRWGGEHNRPGNDGGLFAFALEAVRRCGGVMEHPAFTRAYAAHGIQKPTEPGWNRISDGEWVCEVWQSAYGHLAQKRTWLFYASRHNPPLECLWDRKPGTHKIGGRSSRSKGPQKPSLMGRLASLSPLSFAEFMAALARNSIP